MGEKSCIMADEVNHMLRTFDDIYETMPWDAVDAVVFDVGQVLLSYNPQEIMPTMPLRLSSTSTTFLTSSTRNSSPGA